MFLYRLLFVSILFLMVFTLSVFAQEGETESAKPAKPKSYTEQYKDYYNPKNYTKNYKERFKPENYRKHYHQLHKQNYDSFRNVDDVLRGVGPITAPMNNPQSYRDFQYEKRGYAPYRNSYSQTPTIDKILFEEGKRANALPHGPSSILPDPLPVEDRLSIQRRTPYLFPPYMLHVPLLSGATAPVQDLPSKPAGLDNPSSGIPSSTDLSIQDEIPENQPKETEFETNPNSVGTQNNPQTAAMHTKARSPAQILYDKGLQSFTQRNYPRAEQTFRNLTAMAPGSVYAQFAHGLSLFFVTDYSQSLEAIQRSYELAQQKKVLAPTLDQMKADPRDFRFHYRKLARYVEQNPQDHEASTLLLLLANSGKNTL